MIPQGQPPRRTGGGRGIQPRKPWRSAEGRRSGRLASQPAGTRRSNAPVNIAPALHREHPTPSVPHHEVAWVMLTDMGISAAAQRWGRAGCSRITRSTRLRETDRSRAQTLRCPSPSQGDASRSASMATSRASSEIEGFGPRRFAGGRYGGVIVFDEAARHGQRRRTSKGSRGDTASDVAVPPSPGRAGLRLQNCRDKSSTGSPRKSPGQPHACASPSILCRRNLARGKRGRAKLALVYHRPINSNFVLKIVGHVPVLLGHFD